MKSKRSLLSNLWVFISLNMILCIYILQLVNMDFQTTLIGDGSDHLRELFVVVLIVVFEIPLMMIVLTRMLDHQFSKFLNIVASVALILLISLSLFQGEMNIFYLIFCLIDIVAGLMIVNYAWQWEEQIHHSSSRRRASSDSVVQA